MATILIIFSMIFVFGPIAKAYADRLNRDIPPGSSASAAEIAKLREEVDRLSSEVGRLHEEQSFMLTLLGDGDRKRLAEGRRSDG